MISLDFEEIRCFTIWQIQVIYRESAVIKCNSLVIMFWCALYIYSYNCWFLYCLYTLIHWKVIQLLPSFGENPKILCSKRVMGRWIMKYILSVSNQDLSCRILCFLFISIWFYVLEKYSKRQIKFHYWQYFHFDIKNNCCFFYCIQCIQISMNWNFKFYQQEHIWT